jgi:hypothetical protein
VPIDFSLIKNNDLKDLLIYILKKNIFERATFYDIIKSKFVTNNGKEILLFDKIEEEKNYSNS